MPYLQAYIKSLQLSHPQLKLSVVSIHYPYQSGSYQWYQLPVYSCGGQNKKLPLKLWYWQKCIRKVFSIHKKEKIDVIHTFWLTEAAFLGRCLSKILSTKLVCSAMGVDVLKRNPYLALVHSKRAIYTMVSNFQQEKYYEITGRKTDSIIPWGINDAELPSLNVGQRDIDILGVGSLFGIKNFNLFIDVIAVLQKKRPNIRCCIVGDGANKGALQIKINTLGLQNNIRLMGHLRHAKVLKLMQQSKIFLHTSPYESQGYVFVEALHLGMYIVSLKTGLAHENKKWKVVTEPKKERLAKAVHELLNMDLTFEPLQLYKVEKTVADYVNIYSTI